MKCRAIIGLLAFGMSSVAFPCEEQVSSELSALGLGTYYHPSATKIEEKERSEKFFKKLTRYEKADAQASKDWEESLNTRSGAGFSDNAFSASIMVRSGEDGMHSSWEAGQEAKANIRELRKEYAMNPARQSLIKTHAGALYDSVAHFKSKESEARVYRQGESIVAYEILKPVPARLVELGAGCKVKAVYTWDGDIVSSWSLEKCAHASSPICAQYHDRFLVDGAPAANTTGAAPGVQKQ